MSGTVGSGVKAGAGVVGGEMALGAVEAVVERRVVTGDSSSSSSSSGSMVVVDRDPDDEPEEEEPEPDDDEPEPDEATEGTGASDFPDRSGILSGGVGSGGLALVMNRLKMSAGRDPPLTLATPWTL